MNQDILNTEVQKFINDNLASDVSGLILKGVTVDGVSAIELVEQIEAKRKSEHKLPQWFSTKDIYYPNKLNIEQTSSEIAANYKASVIKGDSIIDLTGGFGVDSFYFSKYFQSVVHCELDANLSKIAAYNFKQLNVKNIETFAEDGISILSQLNKHFDWVFVDPSRRHNSKGKVILLEDCLPDVPKHLDIIFNYTENVAVKTAPLLDITAGLEALKYVKTIHIVAINNEVKELLWILKKNHNASVEIKTVNIATEETQNFDFKLEEEIMSQAKFSKPLRYLYEPNSAILKSGAYKSIAETLGVFKLHQHSHLYTSQELIDFPGRQFKIQQAIAYNKKSFKTLNITKANVTTRNFPETVENLRKKLKIQDGGDVYLFFTTNLNNDKMIIVCSKHTL